MNNKELVNKWDELKDKEKWASAKFMGTIARSQAELQHEAKRRGLSLE